PQDTPGAPTRARQLYRASASRVVGHNFASEASRTTRRSAHIRTRGDFCLKPLNDFPDSVVDMLISDADICVICHAGTFTRDQRVLSGSLVHGSRNVSGVPAFETNVPRNVTTAVGQTAFLHCRVYQLGDKERGKENFTIYIPVKGIEQRLLLRLRLLHRFSKSSIPGIPPCQGYIDPSRAAGLTLPQGWPAVSG
ncbi:hypothetical protein ALC62_02457, partial [Cyphomyrmex costatus]